MLLKQLKYFISIIKKGNFTEAAEENDLKDKTIIPFVTHGGYGAGQTLNQIKELAPESKVLSELSIE